jgi:hypothetical protein
VSQQQNVRQELALELAANMFLPYVLFLPFAVFGLGWMIRKNFQPLNEPYRVCRRPLFLRECPDEKSKIHP